MSQVEYVVRYGYTAPTSDTSMSEWQRSVVCPGREEAEQTYDFYKTKRQTAFRIKANLLSLLLVHAKEEGESVLQTIKTHKYPEPFISAVPDYPNYEDRPHIEVPIRARAVGPLSPGAIAVYLVDPSEKRGLVGIARSKEGVKKLVDQAYELLLEDGHSLLIEFEKFVETDKGKK